MGPPDRAARVPCWQRHQRRMSIDRFTASGFDEPQGRPSSMAKDLLGATVTLAIIGAYLLQVTNALASRCGAEPKPRRGPGACSGVSALASHVHTPVSLCVGVCAALAMVAFIWYMFWGYKVNRRVGRNRDTPGF